MEYKSDVERYREEARKNGQDDIVYLSDDEIRGMLGITLEEELRNKLTFDLKNEEKDLLFEIRCCKLAIIDARKRHDYMLEKDIREDLIQAEIRLSEIQKQLKELWQKFDEEEIKHKK